jgi:membrane-bound serine protease (ClpP class)
MVLLLAIALALFVPSPWDLVVLACGVVLEVGEIVWGLRLARRWRARTGAEAMIGMRAEVATPCRPTGTVRVNGELWEAECALGADVGAMVTVQRFEGLTLVVAPAPPRVEKP